MELNEVMDQFMVIAADLIVAEEIYHLRAQMKRDYPTQWSFGMDRVEYNREQMEFFKEWQENKEKLMAAAVATGFNQLEPAVLYSQLLLRSDNITVMASIYRTLFSDKEKEYLNFLLQLQQQQLIRN